jgi:hypothetical protein
MRLPRSIRSHFRTWLRIKKATPTSDPAKIAVHIGGPFDVLRRANSVRNASEDELAALFDSASVWETRSVWVLLLGLAAEVILVWAPTVTVWTRIGETIATSMVVLGVWTEVAFGNTASKVQTEQLRRSNEKLARAAEAASRADATLWLLERIGSWRQLDAQASMALKEALSEITPAAVALTFSSFDPESKSFATNIGEVFSECGWSVAYVGDATHQYTFPEGADGAVGTPDPVLQRAFARAGIPLSTRWSSYDLPVSPPAIAVHVHPKRLKF